MSRVAITLLILAALILGCGLAVMGAAADPTSTPTTTPTTSNAGAWAG